MAEKERRDLDGFEFDLALVFYAKTYQREAEDYRYPRRIVLEGSGFDKGHDDRVLDFRNANGTIVRFVFDDMNWSLDLGKDGTK